MIGVEDTAALQREQELETIVAGNPPSASSRPRPLTAHGVEGLAESHVTGPSVFSGLDAVRRVPHLVAEGSRSEADP